jgi:hypothetical protein
LHRRTGREERGRERGVHAVSGRLPTIVFASAGDRAAAVVELREATVRVGPPGCDPWAEGHLWWDVFRPGETYLESLASGFTNVDFVVLLLSRDDVRFRGGEGGARADVPRDNLIFEAGYALARLADRTRVVVLVPFIGGRPAVALPSDLEGMTTMPYSLSEPMSVVGARLGRDLAARGSRAVRERTPSPKPAEGGARLLGPIFRPLDSKEDWHKRVFDSLNQVHPQIAPRSLYDGPGLARLWVDWQSHFKAYDEETKQALAHVLDRFLDQMPRKLSCIVDLGVGDLIKGHEVLRFARTRLAAEPRYVGVDASFQMLIDAIRVNGPNPGIAQTIGAAPDRICGINAGFDQLVKCRSQFPSGGESLFLLLGNTLGNEPDERQTLLNIVKAMSPGDHLLLDIQLCEDEVITADEIRHRLDTEPALAFMRGPLMAFGVSPEKLAVEVRLRMAGAGHWHARAYDVLLVPTEEIRITEWPPNGGDNDRTVVLASHHHIPVYTFKRYELERVKSLMTSVGLRLVAEPLQHPRDAQPQGRRYGYFLCRKD